MNRKPPALRRHKGGNWFVRWGGKDRYFGRDRTRAETLYLEDQVDGLSAWTKWRAARDSKRLPPMSKSITVLDLAQQFLDHKGTVNGESTRRFYAGSLKKFLYGFGHIRADAVRAIDLGSV